MKNLQMQMMMVGGRAPVLAAWAGAILALLLAACGATGEGGAPPTLERPVIDGPGGSRVMYRTEEAVHDITLRKDGTFHSHSSSSYGEALGHHEGPWSWKKTGSHGAELQLGTDTWVLQFVSPESAIAVNRAAGGQSHVFQFERM